MFAADLARIYGVTPARLNQQFNRNRNRFPSDFAFQLTKDELDSLMLQIATSNRGGHRKLPFVFTEHGALMLASVLNSETAVEASVRVVRVFIRMREMLAANKELAEKFAEMEKRLDGHDAAIANLFKAIRQLLDGPPSEGPRREIGFHMRETAPPYKIRLPKTR